MTHGQDHEQLIRWFRGHPYPEDVDWQELICRLCAEAGYPISTVKTKPVHFVPPGEFWISGIEVDSPDASAFLVHLWGKISQRLESPDNLAILLEVIDACRPLTPILLSVRGEKLIESRRQVTDRHAKDEDRIANGVHAYCGGEMRLHRISETHNALTCEKCHRSFAHSRQLITFGDLRKSTQNLMPRPGHRLPDF